jgi:hypothetical protein
MTQGYPERWRIPVADFTLTQEQRFLIFRGVTPPITFPGEKPCPAEKGDVKYLSSTVSIEVLEVIRGRKGEHVIRYLLRDLRPNLLRRAPQVHTPEKDETGQIKPPTAADIESARLESSYTHSARDAVPSAGEALPEVDQKLISMRARAKLAERKRTEEDDRREFRALTSSIKETAVMMKRQGIDPGPFLLQVGQLIASQQENLRDAA